MSRFFDTKGGWGPHRAKLRAFIDPAIARVIALRDDRQYRLVDALTGKRAGDCRSGYDLRTDLYVAMSARTRAQWLRLELCD